MSLDSPILNLIQLRFDRTDSVREALTRFLLTSFDPTMTETDQTLLARRRQLVQELVKHMKDDAIATYLAQRLTQIMTAFKEIVQSYESESAKHAACFAATIEIINNILLPRYAIDLHLLIKDNWWLNRMGTESPSPDEIDAALLSRHGDTYEVVVIPFVTPSGHTVRVMLDINQDGDNEFVGSIDVRDRAESGILFDMRISDDTNGEWHLHQTDATVAKMLQLPHGSVGLDWHDAYVLTPDVLMELFRFLDTPPER